jgi:hypothetical protein
MYRPASPGASSATAGALMDEAIAHVGSKACLRPLQDATGFTQGACPRLVQGIKSIQVLLGAHLKIPSCGDAHNLGDIVSGCRFASLPLPLSFKAEVPDQTKMNFISGELQNGSVDVLKVLCSPQPMSLQTAKALCSRDGFIPVFGPEPWNIKRGVQWRGF